MTYVHMCIYIYTYTPVFFLQILYINSQATRSGISPTTLAVESGLILLKESCGFTAIDGKQLGFMTIFQNLGYIKSIICRVTIF